MSIQIQFRRGTTAEHSTFTGAVGEITVDTTKDTAVVHDNSQVGGFALLREDGSNCALSDGSASTPAIKFSSSTTTGIYSPGANQFGIATAGTGRITIDASGNVVVGSTLTAGSFIPTSSTVPTNGLYSPGTNQLALSTNGTGRLFVDASGNVGVGTASPENYGGGYTTLEVQGTSGTAGGIFQTLSFDEQVKAYFYVDSSTNTGRIGTITNHPFVIVSGTQEKLRITSNGELKHIGGGSEGSPAVYFAGSAPSNSLYVQAATGNVGIGTSSPGGKTEIVSSGSETSLILRNSSQASGSYSEVKFTPFTGTTAAAASIRAEYNQTDASTLAFRTTNINAEPTTKLFIDSLGRVGIGTQSPVSILTAGTGTGTNAITINGSGSSTSVNKLIFFGGGTNNPSAAIEYDAADKGIAFQIGNYATLSSSEAARIDSSGRLLVGTSTASVFTFGGVTPRFQVEGTDASTGAAVIARNSNDANGAGLIISKSRGTTAGSNTIVSNNDTIADLRFEAGDGTQKAIAASISAQVDGTPGANDMPGRLVFSVTADGASSPTERMRIDNAGSLIYGTSTTPGADITSGTGFYYQISTGLFYVRSNGSPVAALNRGGNDGTLVEFKQDQTTEGTISVSGTTVSYNGAHLSRWSQLPSGAERTEILRGTVLSNIDEMCEWDEEDNEQLNRMKVSDVEGDKNVSGVFQAWDDDDDTYTNDFYCAMTGDFIIRIAAGITVQRGDLLMSAGDGTAKPQDDDIIRSKTIAKITSTTVSCTYDDGSYCVPCVLMAC